MRFCKTEVSWGERLGAGISGAVLRRGRAAVCVAAMILIAGAARPGQQARPSGADQAQKAPEATQEADTGGQVREQQAGKPNVATNRDERNRQIAEDSAKLLKLATELKKAVDKTTLDTLSLEVVRKADDIEKLAKTTREKVKVSQDSASSRK